MYIIIIGCGKVGLSLAEQLSDENHDIPLWILLLTSSRIFLTIWMS